MASKILENDLLNKGVLGMADKPGLSAKDMQYKFEEIQREIIIPKLNEVIGEVGSMLSPFDNEKTYAVGEYCIYKDELYKCIDAVTIPGTWNDKKWGVTTLSDALKDLQSQVDNAIKESANAVAEEAAARKAEIAIERARIDSIAKLPEGSTTGDAELIDGRVDYKGNTHTNIGEHIREVSSQLSSEIVELKDDISPIRNCVFEQATYSTANKTFTSRSNRVCFKTPIKLNFDTVIKAKEGYLVTAYGFTSTDTSIGQDELWNTNESITIEKDHYFILIVQREDNADISKDDAHNQFVCFPYDRSCEVEEKLDDTVENITKKDMNSNRISELDDRNPFEWGAMDKGYIVFIADDGHVEDWAEMLEMMNGYGYKQCFAPIPDNTYLFNETNVTTNAYDSVGIPIGSNLLTVVRKCEELGGEILCHDTISSLYSSQNPLTLKSEKAVDNAIYSAKKLLVDNGFNVNGYVSPGSHRIDGYNLDAHSTRNIVRQYFSYGCQLLNKPTNFNVGRTSINNNDIEVLKTKVDEAVTNKNLLVLFCHNFTNEETTKQKLEELLPYISSKGSSVEVTTLNYVYRNFASSKLEKRIEDLEALLNS